MNMFVRLFLSFTVLALLLNGCSGSSSNNPVNVEPATGSVTGIIADANNHNPISGVVVSIDEVSFTTSIDGQFILKNIPAGEHNLLAARNQYETYSSTIRIKSDSTLVFDLLLTKTGSNLGSISGMVIPNQKDFHDVTISVKTSTMQQTIVNNDGMFVVNDVLPGTQTVTITPSTNFLPEQITGITVDAGQNTDIRTIQLKYKYAVTVISDTRTIKRNDGAPSIEALIGPPDGKEISIDMIDDGTVIIDMGVDNAIVDRPGYDIKIHGEYEELFDVYIATSLTGPWSPLPKASRNGADAGKYDIGYTNLSQARYVMIGNRSHGTGGDCFVDAVELLH